MADKSLYSYKKEIAPDAGRLRADDEARPVAETLLRISIHKAVKAFRAATNVVVWYDRTGTWVGTAEIVACDRRRLAIDCITDASQYVSFSRAHVEFDVTSKNHGGYLRSSFVCPSCGLCVDKLLRWKQFWACSYCHDTVNVSSRMTTFQRNYIKYLDLRNRIGEDRSPGQRRKEHGKGYRELCALDRYWSMQPPVILPPIWQKTLHERFYRPEDMPDIGKPENMA